MAFYQFKAKVTRILEVHGVTSEDRAKRNAVSDLGISGGGRWVEIPATDGATKAFEWVPE